MITCSHGPCSKSPFGRVIHTKPIWDLRIHSYPPRSSPIWKKTYSLRHQSEQVNNLIENFYLGESPKLRRRYHLFMKIILAGIDIHLKVQLTRASPGIVRAIIARVS